jgi:hypothetical protein
MLSHVSQIFQGSIFKTIPRHTCTCFEICYIFGPSMLFSLFMLLESPRFEAPDGRETENGHILPLDPLPYIFGKYIMVC